MCAPFAKWTTPCSCCRCGFYFEATEDSELGFRARRENIWGFPAALCRMLSMDRVLIFVLCSPACRCIVCLRVRSHHHVLYCPATPLFHFLVDIFVTPPSSVKCTGRAPDQGRRTALTRTRAGDWFGGRTGLQGRVASRSLYSGTRPR